MNKFRAAYNSCKRYVSRKIFHEETAGILNYVTLQITEPEVAKDLKNHMVEQQNKMFWLSHPINWGHFLFQVIKAFAYKPYTGVGTVIWSGMSCFILSLMWTVFFLRYKRYTRVLMATWFLANVII